MKSKALASIIFALVVGFNIKAAFASSGIYNDIKYEITEGEVTITGCSSDVTDLEIPSVIEGCPVTAIKTYAFSSKGNILSATISEGIEELPDGIFYKCAALSEINIPTSVKSIGRYAFTDCNALTKVNIKDIDAWCNISFAEEISNPLRKAKNLYLNGNLVTDVKLSDTTTKISSNAFTDCVNLEKIVIGNNVTTIGGGAFKRCTGLVEIDLNNCLESIGDSAFYNCTSLSSIEIPNSVVTVGTGVFRNCKNLSSVTLSDGMNNIPDNMFAACENITNIVLPDGIEIIEGDAFNGCKNLENINIPLSVTKLEYNVFDGCLKLSAIRLHDGITSIGTRSFRSCRNLTDVELPQNITEIPDYLFEGCTSLEKITVPDNVTKIGSNAFYGCKNLKTVKLSSNLTEIGSSAFMNCNRIKNITLPKSLTVFGDSVFQGCKTLMSIEIPYGTTAITNSMFQDCISLVNIVLPQTVNSIGYGAFCNCKSLGGITIPENVRTIESQTFSGCTDLTGMYIPKSLKTVNSEAFYNCPSFTTVFYGGHPSDWTSISIDATYNDVLKKENVKCYPIKKTFKFCTNCDTNIPDVTDYAIFKPLEIKNGDLVIAGWFDNEELSGSPVTFPYYYVGDTKTLYAAWQERDGTSFERAIIANANESYTIEFSPEKEPVYYEIVAKASGKHIFTFEASEGSTNCYLYNDGKDQIKRTIYGSSNPKSFEYDLVEGERYYIMVENPDPLSASTVTVTIETQNITPTLGAGAFFPGYIVGIEQGKTFIIETDSIPVGSIVFLGCYDEDGLLVKGCSAISKNSTICFEIKEKFSIAKVFVWESVKTMKPLADGKIIE